MVVLSLKPFSPAFMTENIYVYCTLVYVSLCFITSMLMMILMIKSRVLLCEMLFDIVRSL